MSSIYDDSVLIQVPSGYGVGKLYSVIPNTPVGDFDVTRSSWTTRVNKYGYIENVVANVPRLNYDSGVVCPYLLTEDAGTNLITYPISFGNSYWTKSGASIEADSSTAGSELVTNGDFATDSDWIKGAGWSISGGTANHDGLSTGVGIAQNTGITTAGILYKYTFTILNKGVGTLDVRLRSATDSATILTGLSEEGTYTAYYTATSTGVDIVPLSGNTASFSIDNVSVKEVQPFEAPKVKPTLGSELVTNGNFEDGSTDWTFQSSWSISGGKANYDAVTTQDYLKQTMSSIAAGKTVKIQFDISDVQAGKNAFLKLEISGTPELVFTYTTFTEGTYTYYHTITSGLDRLNFVPLNTGTGGSFSIDNVSVKEITTCSWSGGGFEREAFKLVEDTNNSAHYINNATSSVTSGATVTHSTFVKAAERSWIALYESYSISSGYYFDLTNGVLGSTIGTTPDSYSITEIANGWYRISITTTVPSTSARIRIALADSDGGITYQGDGTSGIYIAYAQLEESDYASSLMLPANSVEGSTTSRVGDAITGAGDVSLFTPVNASGVLYAEIAANSDDGTGRWITIGDGTYANWASIYYHSTSNQVVGRLAVSGTQAEITYTLTDSTEFSRVGFRWAENDFSLWVDGVERGTDTSGVTFSASTLNEVIFADSGGAADFYGKTKALGVFDYLYDDQMELLTGDSYATYEALAMAEDYIIL